MKRLNISICHKSPTVHSHLQIRLMECQQMGAVGGWVSRGLSALHKDEAVLQQKQLQNGLRYAWLPFAALSMWVVAVGRRGSREEGHRRRWRRKRREKGTVKIL